MSTIDQRVVRMEFQNEQFESGVKSSIKSLDDLKKSLNFEGASNGLSELGSASKSFSLASIGESVDQISQKFTALGIAGVTALQNITNRAVDAGIALTKSLTVDQLTSGWTKYEQKTASVQTLMNSTGKTMEEINGYLDQMMWFSDETSYGFTDMTAALAQMTSSGGDIEKLVPMLMGMANATAFAGKGATEFQRVVYNLSQSYASGKLQLIDWKSVENAGAASVQLKQALIDAGVALGTIKEGEKTIENFNQDLTESGWVTKEVMEQGFGMFAEMSQKAYEMVRRGDVETASEAYAILGETYDNVAIKAARSAQEAKTFGEAIDATKDAVSSGWMSTFDIIFGNYEEAKSLWTDLANGLWDIFASGAAERNEMLQTWKDLGGRDSLIASVVNLIKALGTALAPIRDAFNAIFPPITAERLFELTKKFEDFTSQLGFTEEASNGIQKIFEAIFTVIKLMLSPLKLVVAAFGLIPSAIGPIIDGMFSMISAMTEGIDFVSSFEEVMKAASDVFNFLSVSYYEGGMGLSGVLEAVFDSVIEVLDFGLSAISNITGINVDQIRESMRSTIQDIRNTIVGFVSDIQTALVTGDWSKFQDLFDFILVSYWEGGEGVAGVLEVIFDSLNEVITAGLRKLSELTGVNLESFIESTRTIIQGVRDAIVGFVSDIQTVFVTGDWSKFHEAFSGLVDSFEPLIEFASGVKAKALEGLTVILTAFATSLSPIGDKMQSGMEKIGNAINPLRIFKELLSTIVNSITDLFGGFIDNLMSFVDKLDFDKIYKTFNVSFFGIFAFGILKVGNAIGSFSKEIKKINIGQVTSAFAEAIEELGNSLKTFQVSVKADVLKKIAISVGILAASLFVLSKLDPGDLAKGITGLTVIMAELAGVIIAFGVATSKLKVKQIYVVGTAFVELAAAVLILSIAVKRLSDLDFDEMLQGLSGTGIALAELVGTMSWLSNNSGKLEKVGVPMVALALAIKTLAKAVETMAGIDFWSMIQGLVGLGGILLELKYAMPDGAKLSNDSALGFIALAAAMLIFSSAIKKLGDLDWQSLLKGLAAVSVLIFGLVEISNSLMNSFEMVGEGGQLDKVVSRFKDASLQFKDVGLGFIEIAVAMVIFAKAVETFGKLDWETWGKGLLGIAIALGEICLALTMVPSDGIIKSASAFMIMAAALVPLAAGLALIGLLPFENIINGLVGIGGAMLLFGMMGVGLDQVSDSLIRISGAFAIFTVALIPLTVAIAALGVLPFSVLATGIGAITVAFVAFAAVGAFFSPWATGILTLSAAFGVFGAALLAAGVGISAASVGLIALAGASASIVAVAGQLAFAISTAMESIVIGIGKGILAVVQVVSENVPVIVSIFKNMTLEWLNAISEVVPQIVMTFVTLITSLSPQIIEAGVNLLVNFLTGIRNTMSEITTLVSEIIVSFLTALSSNIQYIVEAGFVLMVEFLNGIAVSLEQHLPEILEAGLKIGEAIIQGLINALGSGLSLVVDAVKQIGSSMIDGIKNFLGIHSPSTEFEAIGDFSMEGLINGLLGRESDASGAMDGIAKTLLDAVSIGDDFKDAGTDNLLGLIGGYKDKQNEAESTIDTIENVVLGNINSKNDKFTDSGKGNIQSFLAGMKDKYPEVTKFIEEMISTILKTINDSSTKFGEAGKALIQALLEGIESKTGDVENKIASTIETMLKSIEDKKNDFGEAGKALMEAMLTSIEDKKDSFEEIGKSLMETMLDEIKASESDLVNAVKDITSSMVEKIKSYDDDFGEAGKKLAKSMKTEIEGYEDDFKTAGKDLVDGFIDGIDSKISSAAKKAAEMARGALNAAKEELDENSPSKEFFKIGKFVPLGFAEGIAYATRYSTEESENMADEAIDTLKSSISKISDYFSSADFDSAPTIRPVLDLTDIRKGAKSIDGLLQTSRTIDISAIDENVKGIQATFENARISQDSQNATEEPRETNYNFYQYNTSPKALSRSEVYRQTKNLLSKQREVVDKT